MQVQSLGQKDPLEESMAVHPGILVWRITWTEESGRLWSTGSQRVGHDWSDWEWMHTWDAHAHCLKTLESTQHCNSQVKEAWHLGCWAWISSFHWEPTSVPQPVCCLGNPGREAQVISSPFFVPFDKLTSQGLNFLS